VQEGLACKRKEKEAVGIEEDAGDYGIKMQESTGNPERNSMKEGTVIKS
jgi:hypothetical protein